MVFSEDTYYRYIDSLAKMKDVDESLAEATSGTTGITLTCVCLARAFRGDHSVKEDVIRILQNLDAGIMRVWAAYALRIVGSVDDKNVLVDIANRDPFQRKRGGCDSPKNEELFYPVREAARGTLKHLESKDIEKGNDS